MLSQSFRVFCFCSVRLLLLLAFISSCLLSCIVCSFCRHLSWYLLLAVWLKILAPLECILLKTLYGDTHLVLHVRCQSPKGQVHGVHKQTPMTNKNQVSKVEKLSEESGGRPPVLTIVAGISVFLTILWVIWSLLSWLVGIFLR
jgi:hypothetical protein